MSCNKALNIKAVPMNAKWEIEEAFCLSTADQTIASLKGKYFIAYNAAGTKYKVWFSDGVVTEPVVSGTTAVVVTITSATTPALIATAIANAITAFTAMGFTATVVDTTTVKSIYGSATVVKSVEQGTAGTLLELTRIQVGGSIDLGLLDGDVTFDPTTDVQDIVAHLYNLAVH
jgi:hypothetical protein